jgi:hypothetical protein
VLTEFLKDALGAGNVKEISPRQKGKKWTAEVFATQMKLRGNLTEKKTSNQDERDAYQIATK